MAFTVLVDTKEKHPWVLSSSQILGVKSVGLKTGDYTVEGLEDILCIERKASAAELAMNIHQPRFARELERMQAFRFRYLILESSVRTVIEYPDHESKAVREHARVKGPYLIHCLNRMQVKYGVNIIYASNAEYAAWIATNLMKEVFDLVNNENQVSTS